MTIIDKRKSGKNQSAGNRQRFVKRYKEQIKRSIDAQSGSITDSLKGRKATVSKKDINEPDFNLDTSTGRGKRVLPGNKQFNVGDKISKRKTGDKKGTSGSQDGEGVDEFTFVLTKEEFIELYFEDMALPDFIKKSMKNTNQYKLTRAGFTTEGIPPRLDIIKTFKQSMARRIATKSNRYLDDLDLRYRLFIKKPFPILSAHIFFLIDVSGSMGEFEKLLAKKFFLLLYLFLNKEYEKVEITFIRHTQDAQECSEQEFFYSQETGGTIVSEGLKLINSIIDERIDLAETNVYVAQASDGDNWWDDALTCLNELEKVLGKVQYFAYIQTEDIDRFNYKQAQSNHKDLFDFYALELKNHKNLSIVRAHRQEDIYPVIKQLFSKD